MSELIDVANAMFSRRENWKKISEEDKIKYFFIFNRYFSKKYPEKSQLLNKKTVCKSTAMDIWFNFFESKPYPNWFWSKSPKIEDLIDVKNFEILMKKLSIDKIQDLEWLIINYPEIIQEELKFHKNKK